MTLPGGSAAAAPPILRLGAVLCLSAVPLTWIPLISVGGFDLKLPYVAAILLGLVLCLHPARFALGLGRVLPLMALALLPYAFYLLVLAAHVSGGETYGIVPRQVLFLLCGLTVATAIAAMGPDQRAVRLGALAAILGFVAVTEVFARRVGLSWFEAVTHFLRSGDFGFIFYNFLREIFIVAAPRADQVVASEKNLIAVGLFTMLLLYRAAHARRGPDWAGGAMTLGVLGILVLLNTRSVLLMAAVALPLAAWLGAMRSGVANLHDFLFKTLLAVAAMAVLLLILTRDSAAVAQIGDRFSFDDASSGSRVAQYSWAIAQINADPLTGRGLQPYGDQLVHNLFLGAWLHAGLGGFLLVSAAFTALVAFWAVFCLRVIAQPGAWVLPVRPEWVAVLPLLPMFRVWIAGDAGHPGFGEWIALGAFAGMIAANALVRSAAAPSARPPHWEAATA